MFGKKKSVAGLDIGSSSIKMIELEGKLNNLNLVSLGFENLPGDTIIDGQIMELNVVSDVIRSVCINHQVTADRVVTGVSGHSVILNPRPWGWRQPPTPGATSPQVTPNPVIRRTLDSRPMSSQR